MRAVVVSDIHSNLEAFEAVLSHASDAEHVIVLGDIVGYGADPNAVVDRVFSLPSVTCIAGNHDLAAMQRFDTRWFNPTAKTAIEWTAGELGADARALLGALEPRGEEPYALLVHGSVVDPVAEYVVNTDHASESFEAGEFDLCMFGHTHMPTMFARAADGSVIGSALSSGVMVELDPGARHMLNPGSVGQPRDGDPRASFMIFDTDAHTATVHRVEYDVARAQAKIRAAGLPERLADRLAEGR